ncbi:FecR family protein [Algoriphagus aquimarinus]|uniref:FecR family protein n=1 Tax=Algoriphagus aquimarinus TaxID=237018 RepID=UPI0030DD6349|tara:strand:+ start:96035 stop:97018 length:984 start_codon:yes stop_codon:yes gene_type:complete
MKRDFMDSQKIKEQVRKLFNEEAKDQSDIDRLNHWYESLNETDSKPNDIDQIRTDSWESILDAIQPFHGQKEKDSKSIFGKWIWKAAILLLLCGGGYGLLSVIPDKETETFLGAGLYTNDIGKVSTFFLPDGSKVWLSTGSQIEYAEDFPRNRQVRLSGEAFFEVMRNPDFPFVITTGEISTQVLGTSFNLKSYENAGVELSVYSGKVKFFNQKSKLDAAVLLKGEKVSWISGEGISDIEKFDIEQLPDWRQGKITFDNAGIDVIQSTLERWYKVDIKIEGKERNCHYSGEFTQASLEQILETLSYALNLTYKINDANVTIHTKPCE